jgi:hydrogenase expression/formation protein HypC
VMVHVGYAIQKMTPQQARSAWELYDEVLRAEGHEAET